MGKIVRFILVLIVMIPASLEAKRMPPPEVPPITYEGITYRAPNDNGRVAYVDGYDAITGKMLWHKVVFRHFIWPWLEEDVQWTFIKEMTIENGKLVITSERGKQYHIKLPKRPKGK